MSVYELKTGEKGKIISVMAEGAAGTRLSSLGIVKGKEITALSFSLFKSSILIECGAVRLGLRKAVALLIEVEKCA